MLLVVPTVPAVETVHIDPIYIDGIHAVEVEGGMLKFHLFTNEISLEAPHAGPHRVITARILCQASILPVAIAQLVQCLSPPVTPEPVKVFKGPSLVP